MYVFIWMPTIEQPSKSFVYKNKEEAVFEIKNSYTIANMPDVILVPDPMDPDCFVRRNWRELV